MSSLQFSQELSHPPFLLLAKDWTLQPWGLVRTVAQILPMEQLSSHCLESVELSALSSHLCVKWEKEAGSWLSSSCFCSHWTLPFPKIARPSLLGYVHNCSLLTSVCNTTVQDCRGRFRPTPPPYCICFLRPFFSSFQTLHFSCPSVNLDITKHAAFPSPPKWKSIVASLALCGSVEGFM